MRAEIELREEVELPTESLLEPVSENPIPPAPSDLAIFMRRARSAVPVAVVGLFLLGLIAFLHFAKSFAMPIVLALFLAFLLKPIVRLLNDMRIPQTLGAVIVIAVFFVLVSIGITQLAQP